MKNKVDFDWDGRLRDSGQEEIRKLVQALPEDTPSLAWRSDLNAALQKEAVRSRRGAILAWVWKPSVGLALAAGLAIAFVAQPPAPTPSAASDGGIERALVQSYLHSKTSWELTGDGVTANEAKDTEGSLEPDWFREDVGATL